MVIIPLQPALPNYRMTTTVLETAYIFDVRWNSRDAAWYLDLREENGTAIALGIKLVLGTWLARRVEHTLMTQGAFIMQAPDGVDATFYDIGVRVQLTYWTIEELLADTLVSTAENP